MKTITVNRLLGIILMLVGVIGAYVLFRNLLLSLPLIVVGFALLLSNPAGSEKSDVEERPVGVTVIAILTLLASVGLGLFSIILFFLNFIVGGG